MNRRGFLSLLAGGLAAAADPERALWTPGKLISIPRPQPLILRIGDCFTISGHYEVNPRTGRRAVYRDPTTGRSYQFRKLFTVTTAECTEEAALRDRSFFPLTIESGPYRNADVDRQPVSRTISLWPSVRTVERIHE